ncbi:MAG: hypothetical protein NWP87_03725 [Winogradskyella sp.]|nr:hypothetical protein [Winogradskyella sp.]
MSDKLPQNTNDEEVDLGQLFNTIGRLFEKLFSFLGNILKNLFSIIIYALKPIVNNFKIVAIILMVSALIGFIIDKVNKPIYKSDMLVKPYFDSKYELANNVDYFNALISSDNAKELSAVFEIDTLEARELIGFEMKIGPETPNDLLLEYNAYLKNIDSSLTDDVTYDKYVENRDILSGSIFSISARSHKEDIFTSLEKGFIKTFKNSYSEKIKDIRDQAINIKQVVYNKELERIDSIQKFYFEVIKAESENPNANLGLGGILPLTKEKTLTREYDLFREELKIRDSLMLLEEQLVTENDYYDILSGFEEVGSIDRDFSNRYALLLPSLVLTIMILTYLALKIFKFIKEYE